MRFQNAVNLHRKGRQGEGSARVMNCLRQCRRDHAASR